MFKEFCHTFKRFDAWHCTGIALAGFRLCGLSLRHDFLYFLESLTLKFNRLARYVVFSYAIVWYTMYFSKIVTMTSVTNLLSMAFFKDPSCQCGQPPSYHLSTCAVCSTYTLPDWLNRHQTASQPMLPVNTVIATNQLNHALPQKKLKGAPSNESNIITLLRVIPTLR